MNNLLYDAVSKYVFLYSQLAMLQKLKVLDPDMCGIVRFHNSFVHKGLRCMVFEPLDVDLLEFVNGRDSPLSMAEMRPIIQQV